MLQSVVTNDIVCKILSRIVERYLEINNVTVEQVQKAFNELPGKSKPDGLTLKIERLKEEWDEKTEIVLEAVLESYKPNITRVDFSDSQIIQRHLLKISQVLFEA